MALLAAPNIPICELIPSAPSAVRVRFPFGLRLESLRRSIASIPGIDELLLAQLSQLNALLAPFAPIMVLAALALALINCFKAIPDAIMSLSPDPIYDCLDELVSFLPLLLQFIPGRPYLVMIRDILQIVDQFILELIATLETIRVAVQKQLYALDIAESINDIYLIADIECASEDPRQQTINLVASLGVLQTIMCALAIPLLILETFLPGNAKRAVKDLRCAIPGLLAISPPAAVIDNARETLNGILTAIDNLEEGLIAFQVVLRALLEILSQIIGESSTFFVGPPTCFEDCT